MKNAGKNVCAMSEECEGKEADRGLMCADHRAEDDRLKEVIGGGHADAGCADFKCNLGLTEECPEVPF